MERKAIMAVQVGRRSEHGPEVQEVLTRYGCLVEARLGLNRNCEDKGLILLQLTGDDSDIERLGQSLSAIDDVSVKSMMLD
ncbi:MAG: hypothetical protein NUW23_14195 [Firmicutes bacterium]|jgi:hypothetical protein|nr:hypothetical protein [Bacillota bacterium]